MTASRCPQKKITPVPVQSPWSASRRAVVLAAIVIVFSALIAYHNSFSGPFVFDDPGSVTDNSTIRHFSTALSPPPGSTVSGRPFVNLTFALNYALGRTEVRGYHAVNLLIHVLCGLTLFGLVRRTLLRPILGGRFTAEAMPLALAIAVVWTVHPLQTEAVTYISQRAESLMALCYLLTLYTFVRGAESATSHRWQAASVVVCLFGMASKEVMASAPLIVLLYDRTFVAGTFRQALRKSPWLYAGLTCTWLLLGYLAVSTGNRSGTAGFNTGITPWTYLLMQCRAIVHYLQLAVWPSPLIFDYGNDVIQSVGDVIMPGFILLALVSGTVVALWRRSAVGFVGVCFFAILAPSSSIVPVATQTMAEHRMYLPLATVVGLAVIGFYAWFGRYSLAVYAAIAVGLGWLTIRRNEVYRSELVLWSDTVAKRPENPRAHTNLGLVKAKTPGRSHEAIAHYETALRINPRLASAHNDIGIILANSPERLSEAIAHYKEAIRIKPEFAEAYNNLGLAFADIPGKLSEAISHYKEAVRIKPDYAEAYNNLGVALAKTPDRLADAISCYETALRINPADEQAHNNWGLALADLEGRSGEAIFHYEAALRINPDYVEAHSNLALVLADIPGRESEAISHYESALRIRPTYAKAHNNLGLLLANIPSRLPEAIVHYEAALRINPDDAKAHNNLGIALAKTPDRTTEAMAEFEAALRIDPSYAKAHNNLGLVLAQNPSHLHEAIAHYEAALRINPDDAETHNNLGSALANIPGRLPEARTHFEAALRLRPDFVMARENLVLVRQLLSGQP